MLKAQVVGIRALLMLASGILILCTSCFASGSVGDAFRAEENVQVLIQTSLGKFVVALNVERAPISANNFLHYVDAQLYSNASFYRTVTLENDKGKPKIEVIQGGREAKGEMYDTASSLNAIAHEPTNVSGLRHIDGAISMARGDVGTATSEFFICIGDQPALDFGAERNPDKQGFAVFGRVIEGMDIVREIHNSQVALTSESAYTRGQMLSPTIEIISIQRVKTD